MIKKIIQLINHRSSHVEKKAMPLLTPDTNVLQKVTEFVHYSEFKRILDKVVNVHTKDKVKSIAILSELPGEGKTLLCSSLAIGLSKLLNIKILIVNTQTYNAPNALTLDRALEIDDLHNPKNQPQKTLLVKTDILSINLQQNQPQQGIVEYQINDIILKYGAQYDLLLFDTSALSAKNRHNIDPWVVARHVETNILVVGSDTLRKNLSPSFSERRSSDKLKICGLIFNEGSPV